MRRRDALKIGLGAAAGTAFAWVGVGALAAASPQRISRLRIVAREVELAPGVTVPSIAFSGVVQGALIEVHNDTENVQVMHGAAFEDSLLTIPAQACAQVRLRTFNTAAPVGTKHYRAYCAATQSVAAGVLNAPHDIGAYDQRHALAVHRWLPRPVIRTGPYNDTVTAYRYASFNHTLYSASEPIIVHRGEHVHFHFSNEGSTLPVTLALPQHRFRVVALDGNAVPTPREVERVFLGPGESLDAVVTMDRPGKWVLGSTRRDDRAGGLGRVIKYMGAQGAPIESDFGAAHWNYAQFGWADSKRVTGAQTHAAANLLSLQPPLSLHELDLRLADSAPHPADKPLEVIAGERYRMAMTNFTRDAHSLQLLGHELELVSVAGHHTTGIFKDTVNLASYTRIECEFVARNNSVVLAHPKQVSLETVVRT